MAYYIYILSDKKRESFHIGITGDLLRGVFEYRKRTAGENSINTQIHDLVYYEKIIDVKEATERELKIRHWRTSWIQSLVDDFNPNWKDLYNEII